LNWPSASGGRFVAALMSPLTADAAPGLAAAPPAFAGLVALVAADGAAGLELPPLQAASKAGRIEAPPSAAIVPARNTTLRGYRRGPPSRSARFMADSQAR